MWKVFFKIALIFGIQIPGVTFCGRKHFSLCSDEDKPSLDMIGSLEGLSLPGEDKMKNHWQKVGKLYTSCKHGLKVLVKCHFFFPRLVAWENSHCYHYCLKIILQPAVIKELSCMLSQSCSSLGVPVLLVKQILIHGSNQIREFNTPKVLNMHGVYTDYCGSDYSKVNGWIMGGFETSEQQWMASLERSPGHGHSVPEMCHCHQKILLSGQ